MNNRKQGFVNGAGDRSTRRQAEHPDGSGAHPDNEQARSRDVHAARGPYTDGDLPPFDADSGRAPGGIFAGEEASLQDAEPRPGTVADASEHSLGYPVPLEELAGLCREHICTVCPVKKEADETRLRALAEVDNARKRMDREKDEHVRFAAEKVLTDILPALDNLDLALRHATPDKACKDFVMGVDMTRKLMLDALRKHGLEAVGEEGQSFDPAMHEAVGTADDPRVADGEVCSLLTPGYRLRERLLRPARVMVCKRG